MSPRHAPPQKTRIIWPDDGNIGEGDPGPRREQHKPAREWDPNVVVWARSIERLHVMGSVPERSSLESVRKGQGEEEALQPAGSLETAWIRSDTRQTINHLPAAQNPF